MRTKVAADAVTFRIVPEWTSICLSDFTRPDWSGN